MLKFRNVAIRRIDSIIVRYVVAVILQRRRIKRQEPDGRNTQVLEIVQLLQQTLEIPNAVCVAITEGLNVQLINDRIFIPVKFVVQYRGHHTRDACKYYARSFQAPLHPRIIHRAICLPFNSYPVRPLQQINRSRRIKKIIDLGKNANTTSQACQMRRLPLQRPELVARNSDQVARWIGRVYRPEQPAGKIRPPPKRMLIIAFMSHDFLRGRKLVKAEKANIISVLNEQFFYRNINRSHYPDPRVLIVLLRISTL